MIKKKWLFKYNIDNIDYYFGYKKDDIIGLTNDINDLIINDCIYYLYDPNAANDDLIYRYNNINLKLYYQLIEKVLIDIVSNGLYDRCDIIGNVTALNMNNNYFFIEVIYLHKDFEITNTRNELYIIKGLVSSWRYNISHDCKINYNYVSGFKTKVTELEMKYNYRHSHLNQENVFQKTNYCLGFSDIRDRTLHNINLDDLDVMYDIAIIDQFVKWESLEGNPYISIIKLFNYNTDINDADFIKIKDEQIKDLTIVSKFDSVTQLFKVDCSLDLKGNDQLVDIFNDNIDFYFMKSEDNDYCSITKCEFLKNFKEAEPIDTKYIYYFKGYKTIYEVGYTKEEINRLAEANLIKYVYNTVDIEQELNILINNDIYKPTVAESYI
jgi:hypothetical protein